MDREGKLKLSLFSLREGVFIVMMMWSIDKFVRPEHAAKVFEHFYFIPSAGSTLLAACLTLFLMRQEDTLLTVR